MEFSSISQSIIKDLLIGTLQFKLSKRIHFKDIAKLFGCHQDMINFYSSSKKYRYRQNIIDQKIFFREARQNSTYIITDTALMQSLIFSPYQSQDNIQFQPQEPLRQSIKIRIVENTYMRNLKSLEIKFDISVAPEIFLVLQHLILVKFTLICIQENNQKISTNEEEIKDWRIFRDLAQKEIAKDIQQLKDKNEIFLVSYNREAELIQAEQHIQNNKQENYQFLILQLAKIKQFNYSLSAEEDRKKFLDGYRTQLMKMKIQILQQLSLRLFNADQVYCCVHLQIYFQTLIGMSQKIFETLKITMLSKYEQFEESLKSSEFQQSEWFKDTIIYLMNHRLNKQYQFFLIQLL
ncbi:unnamed protein product [Paramecium sonneborni]|uniref:Uncharacterized protein n=1 Tax=Paramecium sonneborni TaxID=65129 RepID=A0A8S1RU31_9CILI|nr:unnamed protein product [Paramecium sonneborni]